MSSFATELANSLAPNLLKLTLLPTEQCCFRCTYCYEDFELGKMDAAIQQGIINLIQQRADMLDRLSIAWFGGEPLMAKDVIYQLSEQMLALCQQHNIQFVASMTTNAYLLDQETFERLAGYNVCHYQITLDGDKADHDSVRKRVDGQGTFNQIMTNLKVIKQSKADCQITLRIHYTPDTWKRVFKLLDRLKVDLLDDERFQVIFKAVGQWGGKQDDQTKVFDKQSDKKVVEQTLISYLFGEHLKAEPFEDDHVPYVCYAAKANNLVIRSNGKLAKCTVALEHPANDVGELLPSGELEIYQERYKQWLIGFQTGDMSQLACPAGSVLRQANSLQSIPIVTEAA